MFVALFLVLFTPTSGSTFETVQIYENPESENYLKRPYAAIFKGERLFVADFEQGTIGVWNDSGRFLEFWSHQGQGPGELLYPYYMVADPKHLYVWDRGLKCSIFDWNGKFIKSFPYTAGHIRAARSADTNRLFLAKQVVAAPDDIRMVFSLLDTETGEETLVKSFQNHAYLGMVQGANAARLKAFAPDVDIQKKGDRLFFGFSETPSLLVFDKNRQEPEELNFDLPSAAVTDDERDMLKSLSFPNPMGGRLTLGKLPNLEIDTNHPKSFYTHFLVGADKIAFFLTPIGGFSGVGNGFSRAEYTVCNQKTGERLARGAYQFSEDATVLFLDNRVLGILLDEEGDYRLQELRFLGF